MAEKRLGDTGPAPTRSDRIYEKSSYFYYRTREGLDIGPFDTQKDAERGVEDFIDFLHTEPHSAQTLQQYASRVA
ncbi:DUF6316 family protein [Halioxenophilus sp. WMMB6]|uniref:DUF6316 family protein n=1 Tax=Halioxenophilus sp. WMMB6 TaxID=3073815 RepID=UPI00295E26BC|nr:DUF6316 family protein [Halioxenophilus sp. WMMB6]